RSASNRASEFLVEVFGEAGRHTQTSGPCRFTESSTRRPPAPSQFWYAPRQSYIIWSCTMPAAELHELTLAEAARLISTRKLSPVEYPASLLARIEALEPQLNAFITRTPDVAVAAARIAEAEIMRGDLRGPLHGVPFALKDIYDTAGILTSGHSHTCIDRIP